LVKIHQFNWILTKWIHELWSSTQHTSRKTIRFATFWISLLWKVNFIWQICRSILWGTLR
jgi:hypothetical protein